MARSMKRSLYILVCMSCLLGASDGFSQTPPKDAFVSLAVGDAISQELADDVTEAVVFAVGSQKKLNFIPKEQLQQGLGYKSPSHTGNCVFDNECLRTLRKKLTIRWFIIARLSADGPNVKIVMSKIGSSGALDVQATAITPNGASDIINKVRTLLLQVIKQPVATLSISPGSPDAAVFIDDKAVGNGDLQIEVTPGPHDVRVTRDGYSPFTINIECSANAKCVVPVKLGKAIVVPEAKISTSAHDPGYIWRIAGWTSTGVGSGLIIMAAVAAANVSSLEKELNDACATTPCNISKNDATSKTEEGQQSALIANIGGVIGGLLLAGGVAAVVLGYLKKDSPSSEGGHVQLEPFMDTHGNFGMGATLRF
ncbi:MAG TPA: PEGA domain-containing protein [Myxococcales bacterium]|nr:PEGA domain-containing protein [Myxococcales bacterium]